MRTIDADALKEIISGNSYILRDSINSMNFGMFWDGIEQAIDESPTIDAVPKWIPCEERLPEPTQEVLVTGINGCVYTSRIVHGEFEYGGNVVAWMPLPEPYKGEKENQ